MRWEIAVGYRYQHSHRHFVGTTEQTIRADERTEVNNKINLMDLALTYRISNRWSVTVGVPVMIAERFNQRTPDQITHSRGFGDTSISARMWVFKPPTETRQNIRLGFGVKLPTGNPGVTDTLNGVSRVVDQSIQLGDGGYGFTLDAQAYKGVGFATFFGSGVYLFNPRETNGVQTGRGRASEAIMSVADQYLYRAGVIIPAPRIRSMAMSMGIRGEGVPVRDAFGGSLGFRRPGVSIALDPGVIYSHGKDQWSFNLPVAVHRDRKRSVTDYMDNRSGDAAFADYIFVVGYSRRF